MFSPFPAQVHSLLAPEGPECQAVHAYICTSLFQLLGRSQHILHTAVNRETSAGAFLKLPTHGGV